MRTDFPLFSQAQAVSPLKFSGLRGISKTENPAPQKKPKTQEIDTVIKQIKEKTGVNFYKEIYTLLCPMQGSPMDRKKVLEDTDVLYMDALSLYTSLDLHNSKDHQKVTPQDLEKLTDILMIASIHPCFGFCVPIPPADENKQHLQSLLQKSIQGSQEWQKWEKPNHPPHQLISEAAAFVLASLLIALPTADDQEIDDQDIRKQLITKSGKLQQQRDVMTVLCASHIRTLSKPELQWMKELLARETISGGCNYRYRQDYKTGDTTELYQYVDQLLAGTNRDEAFQAFMTAFAQKTAAHGSWKDYSFNSTFEAVG